MIFKTLEMKEYLTNTEINNGVFYTVEKLEDTIVIKELEELYRANFKES